MSFNFRDSFLSSPEAFDITKFQSNFRIYWMGRNRVKYLGFLVTYLKKCLF